MESSILYPEVIWRSAFELEMKGVDGFSTRCTYLIQQSTPHYEEVEIIGVDSTMMVGCCKECTQLFPIQPRCLLLHWKRVLGKVVWEDWLCVHEQQLIHQCYVQPSQILAPKDYVHGNLAAFDHGMHLSLADPSRGNGFYVCKMISSTPDPALLSWDKNILAFNPISPVLQKPTAYNERPLSCVPHRCIGDVTLISDENGNQLMSPRKCIRRELPSMFYLPGTAQAFSLMSIMLMYSMMRQKNVLPCIYPGQLLDQAYARSLEEGIRLSLQCIHTMCGMNLPLQFEGQRLESEAYVHTRAEVLAAYFLRTLLRTPRSLIPRIKLSQWAAVDQKYLNPGIDLETYTKERKNVKGTQKHCGKRKHHTGMITLPPPVEKKKKRVALPPTVEKKKKRVSKK